MRSAVFNHPHNSDAPDAPQNSRTKNTHAQPHTLSCQLLTLPPTNGRPSYTVTLWPCSLSFMAVIIPASPAPTTATFSAFLPSAASGRCTAAVGGVRVSGG